MSKSPVSRFAYAMSDLGIRRSLFPRSHDHKTTMSAGLLYPILVDEVLPGDTYSVDTSCLVRMSTPIHPVMDNCYLDTYFFFVPNRIIWDHWKEFMGESPEDPYINPIEYSVPMLTNEASHARGDIGIPPKSILDYMGVPSRSIPNEVSQLPVRAFCKIWNEWFRDQNLQHAIDVPTDDSDLPFSALVDMIGDYDRGYMWNGNEEGSDAYITNAAHGGDLPPVNKYHDYFTSCLLAPQKGNPVPIPLSGFAPVYANNLIDNVNYDTPIRIIGDSGFDAEGVLAASGGVLTYDPQASVDGQFDAYFENLGADLSNIAGVYSTINDLRYAFQLQKFLEADNRGGTRYREILKQHFDVTSPDASQQIPQFLGGKRIDINISQVLQTSATDDISPQGNTAAYSLTTDHSQSFTFSSTEHGWIIGVACIRTDHTYAQGIERFWSKKNKFNFYFPEFATICEQPVYGRELFIGNNDGEGGYSPDDYNRIFGYQEAWAEYRYKPNRISGEFRPQYPQSLDIWHYGDNYESTPYLSDEWIRETRKNIDRTLAVSSDLADQFICDFYFKMDTVRPMPVYSIPGLADHH